MRALITGGAGFVGSHLADALINRGDEVFVLDDLSTGAFRNVAHLKGNPAFRHLIESAANTSKLAEAIDWCEVVYHLAAAVGVELVVSKPIDSIERNVQLTELVLRQAARKKKRVVFTSSSEVYGKSNTPPFREDSDIVLGPPTTARWAYASAKLTCEFLCLAYLREKQVPVTIFRLFNTVGPRQTGRYGMVLPRFVEAALAGRPLQVHGDGAQTRCFCDVEDVVRALVAAAGERRTIGEIYNVGSKSEISIRALAETVRHLVNPDAKIELVPYEKAYAPGFEDMRRRVPDLAKIAKALHWSPQITLEETIYRVTKHLQALASTPRPNYP